MSTLLSPKAIIDATPVNVRQLFESREFYIPDYQRDYVWKHAHVLQLWNDIKDLYGRCTARDELISSPEGYFLGAMVALESDEGHPCLQVIDGQQRLTTLTCLAVVLLEQIPAKFRRELSPCIRSLESIISTVKGPREYSRISLPSKELTTFLQQTTIKCKSKADRRRYWTTNPVAKKLLASKKLPASKFVAALELLELEIKNFLKAAKRKHKERLRSLSTIVSDCLIVLLIQVKSSATAYDLFEGLNYRGMPLDQADLVKNEVIKAADSDADKEKVTDNWNEAKASLSTHDLLTLPDFLHYSYLSRYEFIRAKNLFQSVSSLVASKISSVQYSEELRLDAQALEKLIKGDSTLWSAQTLENLRDLHEVLNIKMAYIPLMAAFRKHESNAAVFGQHVSAVVNFVFRFMKVLEGDVATLARIMHEAAKKIRDGEPITKLRAFFKTHAPDAEFKSEFRTLSAANAKIGYYIVRSIETPLLSGTAALPHGDAQHLEHIMPKAPTKKHWPIAYTEKASDRERYRKTIWRIGNLLPLPRDINVAIQNKPVSWKIKNSTGKSYVDSDLQSPSEIPTFLTPAGEWTDESIDKRQADISERLITKAWPL